MAIVVVGGSSKDIGKTALVCGIISALSEYDWTAVKISGHDYEPASSAGTTDLSAGAIREETSPGVDTDTARYLSAGARRALLVTRFGADVPFRQIQSALGSDRNILFESNRIVDVFKPDTCLAFVGSPGVEPKQSFSRLLQIADALVAIENIGRPPAAPQSIPFFRLQSLDRISPELLSWLSRRLDESPPSFHR